MLEELMRDNQLPGRSAVHATGAMAATSHPAATLAAIDMMRMGGNAIDSAITAAAVLGVVEPHSTSIGGDCFALYAPGGGDVIAINGSGKAPGSATADWFQEQGLTSIDYQSPHAVVVPGCIAAWQKLSHDYGRKGLDACLQPAINFAENGYPIHSVIANAWKNNADKLAIDENSRQIFLPNGSAPKAGDIHHQPALAKTLRTIAERGSIEFYQGETAERMVDYLRGRGGLHTPDDFATTEADYVKPISTDYRGYEIVECPPNGQGIIALEIFNILNGFNLPALQPLGVERLHIEAEATRLAFRDRAAFLADPTQSEVPVDHLLSEDYAKGLRKSISMDKTMTELPTPGETSHDDTVYLTVVDEDRNAVSFINSIFHSFGSGLLDARTGVLFNNRGASFVIDPHHPNCIAPKKRPMHTIIPGMMRKNGRSIMPFGVMGGHYQPVGHVHFATNILDYGMDVQEALDAPRAFAFANQLQIERGIKPQVANGLRSLGHDVVQAENALGGGQAIAINWETGVLTGGSDPRKDGCALGY